MFFFASVRHLFSVVEGGGLGGEEGCGGAKVGAWWPEAVVLLMQRRKAEIEGTGRRTSHMLGWLEYLTP
jgi:hypothetical protein